jgi:hypothetical protein
VLLAQVSPESSAVEPEEPPPRFEVSARKDAFDLMNKKENEHTNGVVCNNCKAEATKLVNNAKGIQSLANLVGAHDSIKINSNNTVTGTYTLLGSRISRSITCDADGYCK